MRRWLGFGLALLLFAFGRAEAQSVTAEQHVDAAARTAFEAGRASYEAGRFSEALAQFERAYLLSPRPGLLYDIARAAESEGNDARAIDAYSRYLELLPTAENRPFAEARLSKLRADAARSPRNASPAPPLAPPVPVVPLHMLPPPRVVSVEREQPPAPPPVPAAPSAERRPLYKSPWLWSGVGLVLAGAAVGLGLGLRPDEAAEAPFRGSSGVSVPAP